MITKRMFIHFFLLPFMAISLLVADTGDGRFPYLDVTPSRPVSNEDTVVVQILVNEAGNSCMAPQFIDVSFDIELMPQMIYPPFYHLYVSFTEQQNDGIVCPKIYDPVDYGPFVQLGLLARGRYLVIVEDSSYGEFEVYEKETVHIVTGVHNVSRESVITFNRHNQNLSLNITRPQTVMIAFYTLNGRFDSNLSYSVKLTEGRHLISLPETGGGVLRVKGLDFEESFFR